MEVNVLSDKRDFSYILEYYSDKTKILHFGVSLDKTKIRLNLTRENFAKIDRESYTKVPAHNKILENWDEWKKQKETLEFNELNTRICPPGLKFEKEGDKLVLSEEYCKKYQDMCLQNYDLNMKFIKKLNHKTFEKMLDKFVKKYNMMEVKDLKECKKKTGIYMAVLDNFNQLYIGQTTKDLKERILNHWKLKPKFDRLLFGKVTESVIPYDSYGALDTTRIFIIYEQDKKKIDQIEKNLVQEIPQKYQTNRIGGGIHLDTIKDLLDTVNTMNLRKLK